MQPKFTLNTKGSVLTRIIAFAMVFLVTAPLTFGQKTEEMRLQMSKPDAFFNPPTTTPPTEIFPERLARQLPAGVVVQRVNAPTTINAPGPMDNGNALITFNFTNTNGFAIILTDISTALADLGAGAPGTLTMTAYYKPGAIVGNPGNINAGNGWTLFGTNTINGPTYNPFPSPNPVFSTVFSGLSLNIPGGATYGICIGASSPNLGYMNSTAAGTTFSNGGCSITVGGAGGWGGPVIPGPPANNPRGFIGSVTFDQAVCVPNAATQPLLSSVPGSTCAGQAITLSVLSGSLNGAASWRWYTGSCGGTLVGTGNSISVSPGATTTYYVRGEGGCAPAPGPCGQVTITVTPCTCVTPDVTSICQGSTTSVQVTPPALPVTQTFGPGPGVTNLSNGVGTPYPSNITVAALPTAGVYVQSVNITGFSHTWPEDVDIALQSPTGQTVILMSDCGGSSGVVNSNYVFTEGAVAVPTPAVSGTYRPTNLVGAFGVEPDNFPAPGPGSLAQPNPSLNMFSSGANPNGQWRILALDDFAGDAGSFTSWSITFRIVPTATWTSNPAAPNTMFTDPGMTTAYVAGSQTNIIYVNPTVTTTYTATIASGPCAGTHTSTVNVLPRPNITISPNPGGCAPVTLTASGGIAYSWSPSTGLSTTTGATTVASVSTDQTYTVLGYAANGCSNTATVDVKGISTAAVISASAPFQSLLSEGFTTVVPSGWVANNLSSPIGVTGWFQGNTGVFAAQSGPPTSYAAANFNNASGLGDISNWLISPQVTVQQADSLIFWTRKVAGDFFPDRLQVRMSTAGSSTNVGNTSTSVGDFTVLLEDINPTLVTGVYPTDWRRYSIPIPVTSATNVRFAFRYFVTGGGPAGANSDYIGIDEVLVKRPLPGVCPNTVTTISVNITGGVSPYTLVFSNGTTQTTYPGYTSGTPIQVSPGTTTTYTIVSVTGANGCPGTGNTGSAVVTVIPPPSITAQPTNQVVCVGGNATFTAGVSPNVFTTFYQWQLSTDGGATWNNITNNATYSGATTTSLTVSNVTSGMNGYRYRIVVNGQCAPTTATSASATLQVNVAPTITTHPVNRTICDGSSTTFSVVASAAVGTVSYQWQVSVDNGVTWTNVPNGSAATLNVTGTLLMNNYRYRVVVTNAPCATTATSNVAVLTVNPLPSVTITSGDLAITPGQTTTITGTSSPAAVAGGWSWTLNGNVIPGAPAPPFNTPTISVGIDGLGTYQATATDANGCKGTSNLLTVGAEASENLWIYPNPNNGNFQIRLYFDGTVSERRRIRIYNSGGALVAQKEFDLVQGSPSYLRMEFALPRLAAGTYVAKVTGLNSGRTVSGLFIVAQ